MEAISKRIQISFVFFLVVLASVGSFPGYTTAAYSCSFHFIKTWGDAPSYRLNLVVSDSLLQYYTEKSHVLYSQIDFGKFVTPYALKPVADCLSEIFADPEDFANGALMLVHQIFYEETVPPKFPVETIVNGKGDCDLFSYVAASILEARGFDTILLYFENEAHMNIGIELPSMPVDARTPVSWVTHDNVRYYVAECTGDDWQTGWRVGELPDELDMAKTQIITLENQEAVTTGQVSASYEELETSSLSLAVSSTFGIQGSLITLTGRLTPGLPDQNVTLYVKVNNSAWKVIGTAGTNAEGRYSYAWDATGEGICYVRANWSGDETHAAADSPVQTLTIFSMLLMSLIAILAIIAVLSIIVYVLSKRGQPETLEPVYS